MLYDWLIVGAGFAGSVLAERLASQCGDTVALIDRRKHVGGNAYDRVNDDGLLVHQYGPHIFHTNSKLVLDYLSQFTRWRPYEHRVRAFVEGRLLPIPINRTTLNELYGSCLETEEETAAFLRERAIPKEKVITAEDVVLGKIGRDLYEKFFRGYTRKQWGCDPAELDRSVTARVPVRLSTDDRYFSDAYQLMPADGYTRMFERMLDHDKITVMLGSEFADVGHSVQHRRVIFTGAVDAYFDYRLGRLPYRSLRFEHKTLNMAWHQPVGVVNYPGVEPYTRVTEYKHLTGQQHSLTSITLEFPSATGEPYYPIPRPDSQALYRKYERLARAETGVHFSGRLGTYAYYNMDQVVAQSLALFRRLKGTAVHGV